MPIAAPEDVRTYEDIAPFRVRESMACVLLVEDDDLVREAVAQRLSAEGHEVLQAASAGAAREVLQSASVELVLLDQGLPDADDLGLLREIVRTWPDTAVVMLTGFASVSTAVQAIREGAHNYLTKPVDLEQIVVAVDRALETHALRREVHEVRRVAREQAELDGVIGGSPEMLRVKALVAKFAQSPASTVLVTGESGTGKDVIARALHTQSERANGPFTNITCSAMPEALLESELFGHEKGAFTGAHQQKKGLLELADHGTVFLDEIGEMSPVLQAKLLRFLESKTFRRVGGSKDLKPDVRVIAATHRDLRAEIHNGRFREDLFYRLSVLHVHLPPLRSRRADIAALVEHFLQRFDREFHKSVRSVRPETMAQLERYAWPGNVRELRNAVERAVLLAEGAVLDDADFDLLAHPTPEPSATEARATSVFVLPPEGVDLAALERSLVEQALARAGGNRTRAGRLLGLNRDQVRYRAAKLAGGTPPHDEPDPV